MNAGPKALAILKHYEQAPGGGFATQIYLCPAKKPTIGWGHVVLPMEHFNLPMDEATAEKVLEIDCNKYAMQLNKLLTRAPTQDQFDAMLSLAFNVGVGKADGIKGDFADSDLLAYFNKGQLQLAAAEFPKWCHALGIVMAGLVKRRRTEQGVFLGGPVIFY